VSVLLAAKDITKRFGGVHALDEVSFAAEGEVGGSLDDAIGPGWNDGGDTAFFQGAAQGIGVVGLVASKASGST